MGTQCERFSVTAIDDAKNLGIFVRGRHVKLPIYHRQERDRRQYRKLRPPVVAVNRQKATPSIEFSTARGNFEHAKRS